MITEKSYWHKSPSKCCLEMMVMMVMRMIMMLTFSGYYAAKTQEKNRRIRKRNVKMDTPKSKKQSSSLSWP